MSRARKTLWHTGVYTTGLIINRGVAFLLIPLYTRQLSEENFAAWDLATTTVLFLVPLMEMGLGAALLRFFHDYESESEQRRVFQASISFLMVVMAVLLPLAIAFRAPLAGLIFQDTSAALLIPLTMLVACITILGNQPLALLRAQEKSIQYAGLNLARALVGPVTIVIMVVVFDWGVAGILVGDIVGLGALAGTGLFRYRHWLMFRLPGALLKEMLAFGLPLIPASVAVIVTTLSDRFILASKYGLEAMAPFALGFKIALMMTLISRALQTSWPPTAFQLATEPDGPERLAQYHRFGLLFFMTFALGLSCFSTELVALFGPPAYADARLYVPLIAMSYAIYAGVSLLTTTFAIAKTTVLSPVVYGVAAVLKVILTLGLVRYLDFLGAAAATLISFGVAYILAYSLGQRVYRIPYDVPRIVALTGCGLGLGALVYAAFPLEGPTNLIARIGILVAFPILLTITGAIPTRDWKTAATIVRSLLERRFSKNA